MRLNNHNSSNILMIIIKCNNKESFTNIKKIYKINMTLSNNIEYKVKTSTNNKINLLQILELWEELYQIMHKILMRFESVINKKIYMPRLNLEEEEDLLMLQAKNNMQHYPFNNNNKNTNSIHLKVIN